VLKFLVGCDARHGLECAHAASLLGGVNVFYVDNVRTQRVRHLFTTCPIRTVEVFQLLRQMLPVLSSRIVSNTVLAFVL
jgi:hypothetical protein